MSKSKSVSIDTKKARILSICFVAVFIIVVFVIPIVHVAAEGTDSIDWGVKYEVGRVVEGNNRIKTLLGMSSTTRSSSCALRLTSSTKDLQPF